MSEPSELTGDQLSQMFFSDQDSRAQRELELLALQAEVEKKFADVINTLKFKPIYHPDSTVREQNIQRAVAFTSLSLEGTFTSKEDAEQRVIELLNGQIELEVKFISIISAYLKTHLDPKCIPPVDAKKILMAQIFFCQTIQRVNFGLKLRIK